MMRITRKTTSVQIDDETNAKIILAFLRREISPGNSHYMRFVGADPSLTKVLMALSFPVGVVDE